MNKHTHVSLPADIVIGKDVLELVSSAMYVDPLTIYREYVQNAADSIDAARAAGVLGADEVGRVDINLDLSARSLTIRDNGLGVPNDDFRKRLTAIGGSHKRGTLARGFRGVGRLAGLGYCQELIFRSRANGNEVVQELRWDCKVLKKLLSDPDYTGDLHDLVQEVAKVTPISEGDWPEHFYEVEMVKPVRGSRDQLLNRDAVATYLSQVAPVPFSPEFKFAALIREHLAENLRDLGEIHIHVDGAEEPLYRPYRDDYSYAEGKRDTLTDLQLRTIEDRDGGIGAVVWFAHHGYYGAIPVGEGVGGLRARKGNIQIGDHRIFAEAFKEARFASWTVGEVHILDPRVQPNGRRDEFEQNVHYEHLVARLSEIGTEIGRMCRNTSDARNRLKKFEFGAQKVTEKLEILEQGAIGGAEAEAIGAEIRSDLHDMKKLTSATILLEEDRLALAEKHAAFEERLANARATASGEGALSAVPEAERATVQRMIKLIYECSQNRVVAKSLVDRILVRLGDV